jgi:hypothetical protein
VVFEEEARRTRRAILSSEFDKFILVQRETRVVATFGLRSVIAATAHLNRDPHTRPFRFSSLNSILPNPWR